MTLSRRRLLGLCTVAATAGLAGCGGSDATPTSGSGNGDTTDMEGSGSGDGSMQAPSVSFSFEYNPDAKSSLDGQLSMTHNGGDTVLVDSLTIRGTGLARTGSWIAAGGQASGTKDGAIAVVTGDTATIQVSSDYEVSLVWAPEDADVSSVLAEDSGPDA